LLAIFGFFRCYPMYLVDEFRLNVSPQVSEFVAWLAVPIVIANLWLTDFLADIWRGKELQRVGVHFRDRSSIRVET
jgi:hypothetical protein